MILHLLVPCYFVTLVEYGNQSFLLEKNSLSVFQNARLWQICQKAPFVDLPISNENENENRDVCLIVTYHLSINLPYFSE